MRERLGLASTVAGMRAESSPELHPELRLADLLVAGEEVPVPVERILQKFADVAEVAMPHELAVDAVTITASGTARPRVLINQRRTASLARKRFTLAHELAHVVIPWHVGTIGCSTKIGTDLADNWTAEREAEANRFAARLLVPQEWLLNDVVPFPVEEMMSRLSAAKVSTQPALIRLVSELPSGWLLASVPPVADLALASPGSVITTHAATHTGPLNNIGDERGVSPLNGRAVRWWHWQLRLPPYPSLLGSGQNARRPAAAVRHDQLRDHATQTLRRILERVGSSDSQLASLAGVTGLIADRAELRTPAGLFSAFRQRFDESDQPRRLTRDPEFEEYLGAKAWQLGSVSTTT